MTSIQPTTHHRPLCVIAREIRADWKKPYFGAVPYLSVMGELQSINDTYICDSARDIVNRFLANASTWRGDKARALKAELNSMLRTSRGA